eukprot:gene8144-9559_t
MNKLFSLFVILAVIATSTTYAISTKGETNEKIDLCPTCIDFMGDSLQELIDIIMNGGVMGSCSDLCGKLPGSAEQVVCDLLCAYVGIEEFIKIINAADPDPIYMCELISVCPIRDNGAANVTNVQISPTSGPQGTQFDITVTFQVTAELGTGQIAINVIDPIGESFGGANVLVNTAVGQYNTQFQFTATPSEQEPFQPGNYEVQAAICEGTCGSIHPHAKIYNILTGNFTITA